MPVRGYQSTTGSATRKCIVAVRAELLQAEIAVARRKGRHGKWSALAVIGALAAMVVVVAVAAFTLHKGSPLIAAHPQITTYQPASTAETAVAPLRGLSGSERSIEGSPEPRARERAFVPLAPGELRGSASP
jgi:hypothetical protein